MHKTQPDKTELGKPKLRQVQPQWTQYNGNNFLTLRDPLALSSNTVLVPDTMASIIPLLDGSRDIGGLQSTILLRSGMYISQEDIKELLTSLNNAYLLENQTSKNVIDSALEQYQNAPYRQPAHSNIVYPGKKNNFIASIHPYEQKALKIDPLPESVKVTGMVSPHIDYQRGGEIYAQLWRRCSNSLKEIELVILLGTDHNGRSGSLTLTKQNYATPIGQLPTEVEVVRKLSNVIGTESAFADEIHHINEHSIELSCNWLHRYLERPVPMVPILCGSFYEYLAGNKNIEEDEQMNEAIDYLKKVTKERRTLVIAAGDLSHVGPAFGDRQPINNINQRSLAIKDAESIKAIDAIDSSTFIDISRKESDQRKICGIPPIYVALKLLAGSQGESMGYKQCPADNKNTSYVSIVGSIFHSN